MEETLAYLIPQKNFIVGEFKSKVENIFKQFKVINGYYDEDRNWFSAGDNSSWLFADNRTDGNPLFEYVEIHDTAQNRLLPEGQQAMVKCSQCHADITETVNNFLAEKMEKDFYENLETDMATIEVVCSNCGQKSNLTEFSFGEKSAFTNQFVCFVAVSDAIDEEKLTELSKQLNTPFEVIYGSL